ncbi:MAG: hypothetical protein NC177_17550 [Ruminococcus flavefaciens]|nr:hypothetical protein [Ruminococcus flavefaciens]
MKKLKKVIEITGTPLFPIETGVIAIIYDGNNVRKTSIVVNVQNISQTEIKFETLNTSYHLHNISGGNAV